MTAGDRPAAAKTAGPQPVPVPLGDAAASSDPSVHHLLAQRQTAERNGDGDALRLIDAALAALGVAV